MKTKLISITALFCLACFLFGAGQTTQGSNVGLGVPIATVTNSTKYNLKVTLQFKDGSSKEEMVENYISTKPQGGEGIEYSIGGASRVIKVQNSLLKILSGAWAYMLISGMANSLART